MELNCIMKKSGKSKFLLILILLLTACSSESIVEDRNNEGNLANLQSNNAVDSKNKINEPESKEPTIESEMEKKNGKENKMSDLKVKLKFANEEVTVRMDNTQTSQDFLSLLPLTLTFEDYAGTEKISYLPRKLVTEGAPDGVEASSGDLTYYAPWGNLAIFYQDFRYSNGLIKLGKIESGIEKLANLSGDFEIVIEKMD
ncbi:hypothetical protein SAMN05878482_1107 [Peribacillus simplex]|uniref:Cyclophilin-like domain-containing protein n=1 Tax=Peribacillus simplex TaxID=1478 RepID=A0A9X8RDS8_9BACI|nr:cyclophilin-like fold protein [Peribacillus simplex]SIS03345.1 hypothetical protein SAMN05878482_1107 [Peribacillus simplex]